jgi:hypothetical protein
LVLLTIFAGCGGASASTSQLKTRAAFDLNCPESAIEVSELDKVTRGVRGCGKQRTYVESCKSNEYGNYDCTWVMNSSQSDTN